MSDEIDHYELAKEIDARRAALGITDADDDLYRNSGSRRTERKREILREIAERCAEAGVDPLVAYY
jgi:hypothetical protein